MYLFKTTNAAYGCDWKSVDSTSIMGRRIPSVSFVMGNVPPSHRRPIQMGLRFDEDSGLKCTTPSDHGTRGVRAHSPHTSPRKFPVDPSCQLKYPAIDKKGVDNPMYATASAEVGGMCPKEHHLPERYFPKSNDFSQSFANRSTRFCGLATSPSMSRIHKDLDSFY